MFREVRKKKNGLRFKEVQSVLEYGRRGVLAMNGDDGYPYAIPINYLYSEKTNAIYFHGAKAGYKVDSIKACDKVCFTVYIEHGKFKEEWAPVMKSAVVFGRCMLVEDRDETVRLLKKFAMKYYPTEKMVDDEIEHSAENTQMFKISIEHISGKIVQEK